MRAVVMGPFPGALWKIHAYADGLLIHVGRYTFALRLR